MHVLQNSYQRAKRHRVPKLGNRPQSLWDQSVSPMENAQWTPAAGCSVGLRARAELQEQGEADGQWVQMDDGRMDR